MDFLLAVFLMATSISFHRDQGYSGEIDASTVRSILQVWTYKAGLHFAK